MSNFFLNDYGTTWAEKLTFLVSPVYGDRHYAEFLEAETWQGRHVHLVMAGIEKTPLFGALVALVEAVVACIWFAIKNGAVKKGWEDVLSDPTTDDAEAPSSEQEVEDAAGKGIVPEEEPVLPSSHKLPPVQTRVIVPQNWKLDVPPVSETAEEIQKRRDATAAILSTLGFIRDPDDRETHRGYRGEVQGNAALRFATAIATRDIPGAISPYSLKEQREINLEQYLILKLKRFAHAHDLRGFLTLPSGREFNIEGFCEAFTVPMIASSFQLFARRKGFFTPEDAEWIVKHFNQTTSSDYTAPDDIQVFPIQIQDPDFKGPISLGTGHLWHSTGTLFFGNYLLYGNRGFGDNESGIHIYFMPDRSRITDGVIWEMTKRQEGGEMYGHERIVKDLGGQVVHYFRIPPQQVGNCTYTSMGTLLFTFMVLRQLMNFYGEEGDAPHIYTDPSIWENAFATLEPIYKEWEAFDRELVFNETLEEIEEWASKKTSFSNHPLEEIYRTLLQIWHEHQKYKQVQPYPPKVKQLLDFFGVIN